MERLKDQSAPNIGQSVISLESVASTNQYAREWIANTRPEEGTVIIATHQTGGRGQAGNIWHAAPGLNLTASYILYPSFLRADRQFYLNMAVSLAVREACEVAGSCEITIKWPNDLYAGDYKLGGILIENTISGEMLGTSIVGIGINLNQMDFPEELPNPVSLKQWTGKEILPAVFLEQLSLSLGKYYRQLQLQHLHFLERAYQEALYLYQKTAEFKKNGVSIRGEIAGVARDGKLMLHSQGKELRFAFKEVVFPSYGRFPKKS